MTIQSAIGVSAPERAGELESLWRGLPADATMRLFYRWLDVVFRRIIPDGYARLDLLQAEETLKELPTITDDRTLREAHDALTSLPHPEGCMDFLAGIYSVLGSVRPLLGSMDLYESCFSNIMASRLVYGDDRSFPEMREDIRAAKEACGQ